jgi:threonine dehydrogenase-like Zn-dependent dehydrogenase
MVFKKLGAQQGWAVSITGPGEVGLVPLDLPTTEIAPDEVEGPTVASLVSPGTEVNWYFKPSDVEVARLKYPITPGYAAVFEIRRVGSAVKTFVPGDLVLDISGLHASWQRAPAARLLKLPEGLSPKHATFARLISIPMAVLSTTMVRPPEPIGVSGLGLIGNLAANVMAIAGYVVVAWDSDTRRRNLLKTPSVSVLPEAPEPVGFASDDPAAIGHLSMVIECRGNPSEVLKSCATVRQGGEVVLVGVSWRASTQVSAHELLRTIFHRYVSVRSGWEYQIPFEANGFRGPSTRSNLVTALDWLVTDRLPVDHLAENVSPERAKEVYQGLSSWHTLSAVFDWSQI